MRTDETPARARKPLAWGSPMASSSSPSRPGSTSLASARVEAARHGDVANGVRHVVVDDAQDAERGLVDLHAERGELFPHRGFGRLAVEPHAAAEEKLGVDVAEAEERVGHRRLGAAESVARRPGPGAGALRAHAQGAAGIDPGD